MTIGNKDHRQMLAEFVLDFIRAWSGPEICYIRAGRDGGTDWAFALPLFGTENNVCYDFYPR